MAIFSRQGGSDYLFVSRYGRMLKRVRHAEYLKGSDQSTLLAIMSFVTIAVASNTMHTSRQMGSWRSS